MKQLIAQYVKIAIVVLCLSDFSRNVVSAQTPSFKSSNITVEKVVGAVEDTGTDTTSEQVATGNDIEVVGAIHFRRTGQANL